jgi:hypothetical protein
VREKLPTSLDVLPGNGTGASSPSGEDTQGPSPVDYNLEIEAEFPPTMVIELQKNAALRARKIVATPLWPSVGVKPNTPKVGDLESSGTPECLGFDSKAQNTSY